MVETVLKRIISLEILGISHFVLRTTHLYFKYRYGENTIEENMQKAEVFLDNPKVVKMIKNLKEIPYQG